MNKITLLPQAAALAGLTLLAAVPVLAQSSPVTINFDTLSHPVTGVGPATRVYQEFGPGSFTLLRIADTSGGNPASYGAHFHTVAGNSDPSNPASDHQTAAEFFSDDGEPFFSFYGDYKGTSTANYAPSFSTAKTFSLTSFDVLDLAGTFQLTASASDPASLDAFSFTGPGPTLTIDHTGIYNLANTPGLAGFQNILAYRQDYTGTVDGHLVLDDITITPAAVPEASSVIGLGLGLAFLGALALRRRRRLQP